MPDPSENRSRPETNPVPAAAKLASVPDTANLMTRLEQDEAEMRRLEKRRGWYAVAFMIALPAGVWGLWLLGRYLQSFTAIPVFLVGGIVLVFIVTGALQYLYSDATDEKILLAEQRGPQAIDSLVARLDAKPSSKDKERIWQSLNRLLERISIEEANALPSNVRARFHRRLEDVIQYEDFAAGNAQFCLTWLQIMGQVGNAQDLRAVKFAAGKPGNNPELNAIRDRAQDCVRDIEARIAAQEPGRTLLRASAAPPDRGETLLRPAAKSNPTAPDELLRPAEPEEDAGES